MTDRPPLLHRLTGGERRFLREALRDETVGGGLLLVAAAIAIIWATADISSYHDVQDTVIGPAALHLNLTLEEWAADGALTLFFFIAGLELKRELVIGELRNRAEAVLPVAAAICGIVAPALVYLLVTRGADGSGAGWAVPTATDIAFALAVLAIIGSALPTALRAFLLTLAVVDDLGAIVIIAVFYTDELHLPQLGAAALPLLLYAYLQHRRITAWWIYVLISVLVWALVHASGIHATVAGVALGLLTRVRPDSGEKRSPAERLEHRLRPLSAGVAVPFFALMSAGVTISASALSQAFRDIAAVGVIAGLVIGKTIGVFAGTYLTARFTRAELNRELRWADVFGVAVLAGVGFTVALLIDELAFSNDPERLDHVKAAILAGSVIAAALASVILRLRNAKYRAMADAGEEDDEVRTTS